MTRTSPLLLLLLSHSNFVSEHKPQDDDNSEDEDTSRNVHAQFQLKSTARTINGRDVDGDDDDNDDEDVDRKDPEDRTISYW